MRQRRIKTRELYSLETSLLKWWRIRYVRLQILIGWHFDSETSQSARKSLIRHFTSRVPGSKVESVRFRSIAFQNPTSELPKDEDESKKTTSTHREKHDAERVLNWQAENPKEETNEKVYLKPNEKKRIAFIKQEFHPEAGSINAYIVFALSDPDRSTNVPSILDPFEAAMKAVEACDGSTFMERTIRVDIVHNKGEGSNNKSDVNADPKLSVFVGNLEFTAKEEELRSFFENLIAKELDSSNTSPFVKHVRIIRDPATQLGKGFGYVEFKASFFSSTQIDKEIN